MRESFEASDIPVAQIQDEILQSRIALLNWETPVIVKAPQISACFNKFNRMQNQFAHCSNGHENES